MKNLLKDDGDIEGHEPTWYFGEAKLKKKKILVPKKS